MSAAAPSAALAVDVSCSGLVVATPDDAAVLCPAVAPASVVAAATGGALPAGGDRLVCSAAVDALLETDPGSCLRDPLGAIDSGRVTVAGLSVTADEVVSAPFGRAAEHVSAGRHDSVVAVVPSHWGRSRNGRLTAALERRCRSLRVVRAALVVAGALPSSTAAWVTVVEAMADKAVLSLVRRSGEGVRITARRVVHRVDPVVDSPRDDFLDRVLAAAADLRRSRREARSGSHEILACGAEARAVVAACDRRLELSFVVPPAAAAEAAVRLG